MKLKDGFITHETGDEQVMIAAGKSAEVFHGMVRSNRTAAFIVNQLKEETTVERIIDAMVARYDAPRTVIAADVERVVGQLRAIGALSE